MMSAELLRWGVLLAFALASGLCLQALRLRLLAAKYQAPAPVLTRGEELTEQQRQLEQAGFAAPDAVANLRRAKLLCALLAAIAGAFFGGLLVSGGGLRLYMQGIFALGFGLLGLFLPTIYVDRRRRAWRLRVHNAVPDALDFMQVCMEAGQSVDAALMRVTDELDTMHPELAQTFRRLTEALAAGASRQAAFAQMADETENEDLRQFANMMEQVTAMGASVSHTLRQFTDDLRDRKIRTTEARANLLPTKMTLGSMLFTVPPLLIVLLAPAVSQLLNYL